MAEKCIDIDRIRRNVSLITENFDLIAVVKADAYGHGALTVSRAIENSVCGFAVANADEARELAEGGIKKDIIVFGKTRDFPAYKNIIRTFSDINELATLKNGERVAVKIDTGMHRYGAEPAKARELIDALCGRNALHSVYTHLRCPSDKAVTDRQCKLFRSCVSHISGPIHVAASRALNLRIARKTGTVRCGVALYGGIRPFSQAMSVFGKVLCINRALAGEGAGYGNSALTRDSAIAVLDIGYADGYRRTNKDRYVFIRGKRRKVLSVCMDCTLAEVDEEVNTGDVAEFLGDHISAYELAAAWNTDPYELFTTFGKNFKKLYMDD